MKAKRLFVCFLALTFLLAMTAFVFAGGKQEAKKGANSREFAGNGPARQRPVKASQVFPYGYGVDPLAVRGWFP